MAYGINPNQMAQSPGQVEGNIINVQQLQQREQEFNSNLQLQQLKMQQQVMMSEKGYQQQIDLIKQQEKMRKAEADVQHSQDMQKAQWAVEQQQQQQAQQNAINQRILDQEMGYKKANADRDYQLKRDMFGAAQAESARQAEIDLYKAETSRMGDQPGYGHFGSAETGYHTYDRGTGAIAGSIAGTGVQGSPSNIELSTERELMSLSGGNEERYAKFRYELDRLVREGASEAEALGVLYDQASGGWFDLGGLMRGRQPEAQQKVSGIPGAAINSQVAGQRTQQPATQGRPNYEGGVTGVIDRYLSSRAGRRVGRFNVRDISARGSR
ncbi:hypothetical protein N9104_01760 [Pseudomonadales bacterium]|nr:hypothetical protein [Pseudomonadales bacterium]